MATDQQADLADDEADVDLVHGAAGALLHVGDGLQRVRRHLPAHTSHCSLPQLWCSPPNVCNVLPAMGSMQHHD